MNAIAWAALAVGIYGALYGIGRALTRTRPSDYRSRNDRVAAQRISRLEGQPERQEPGTDHQLFLDCIAVYGDCEELDRLRDAIDQHRKETP